MNQSDRHEEVTRLFLAARELAPDERAEYLRAHCRTRDIRREVETMLAADAEPEGFLSSPVLGQGYRIRWTTSGAHREADDDALEMVVSSGAPLPQPKRIGPYRILDALGEGGMAVVYLAEQEHPPRRVAIKVLKLRKAVDIDTAFLEEDPGNPEHLADLAGSRFNLGRTQEVLGETEEALRSFDESIRLSEQVCALEPHNGRSKRLLYIACLMSGDILNTMGRRDEALARHERALPTAEKRVAADPDDMQAKRDLAYVHERLGYAAMNRGRVPEALDHFQRGLEARTAVVAKDPDDTSAAQNLLISKFQVAEAELELDNHTKALAAYEAALELGNRILDRDPSDAWMLYILTGGFDGYGKALMAVDDIEAARAAYERMLALAGRWVERDPADTGARSSLATAHLKIGDVERKVGGYDRALESYRRARESRHELVQEDPANATHHLDLVESYERIGDLLGNHMRRPDEAAASYQEALRIRETLAANDPEYVPRKPELARDLLKLGMFRIAAADRMPASDIARRLEALKSARSLYRRASSQAEGNAELLRQIQEAATECDQALASLRDGGR